MTTSATSNLLPEDDLSLLAALAQLNVSETASDVQAFAAARLRYEKGLLVWLKQQDVRALTVMSEALEAVAAQDADPSWSGFWRLASLNMATFSADAQDDAKFLPAQLARHLKKRGEGSDFLPCGVARLLWSRLYSYENTPAIEAALALLELGAQYQGESLDLLMVPADKIADIPELPVLETLEAAAPAVPPVLEVAPEIPEVVEVAELTEVSADKIADIPDIPVLETLEAAAPAVPPVLEVTPEIPEVVEVAELTEVSADKIADIPELPVLETLEAAAPAVPPVLEVAPEIPEVVEVAELTEVSADKIADIPELPVLETLEAAAPAVPPVLEVTPEIPEVVEVADAVEVSADKIADIPDIPVLETADMAPPVLSAELPPIAAEADIPVLDEVAEPMVPELTELVDEVEAPVVATAIPVLNVVSPLVAASEAPAEIPELSLDDVRDAPDIPVLTPEIAEVAEVPEVAELPADKMAVMPEIPVLETVEDVAPAAAPPVLEVVESAEVVTEVVPPVVDAPADHEAAPVVPEVVAAVTEAMPETPATPAPEVPAPTELPADKMPVMPPPLPPQFLAKQQAPAAVAPVETSAPAVPAETAPAAPKAEPKTEATPTRQRVLHTNIFSSKDAANSKLMPPQHIDQVYPRLVVMRTLAAALQSNWARLTAGSASHFGLFRDALGILETDVQELDAPYIAQAIQTLSRLADALPLSGPSPWQAEHTARMLDVLGATFDRFPAVDEATIARLNEASAFLAQGEPSSNTPPVVEAPPAVVQEAPSVDVPPPIVPPPASISVDQIPQLQSAEDLDLNSEENTRAIEQTAFYTRARELLGALSREHLTTGNEAARNQMRTLAVELMDAAARVQQTAIAELSAALALALQRSAINVALIELAGDSVLVLGEMLEELRQNQSVTRAPDLVAALNKL